MNERLKKIETNLARLEHKFTRGHEHLFTVLATQRDRIDRALDSLKSEFRFALLEQEVALRGELLYLRTGMSELTETVVDLTEAVGDHELRIRRLEEDRPPAA